MRCSVFVLHPVPGHYRCRTQKVVSRLPALRPLWPEIGDRQKMTICIAAACALNTTEHCLILCSDALASSTLGAANNMLKQRIVGDTYWCLTAGFSHDIFPL